MIDEWMERRKDGWVGGGSKDGWIGGGLGGLKE